MLHASEEGLAFENKWGGRAGDGKGREETGSVTCGRAAPRSLVTLWVAGKSQREWRKAPKRVW